MRREVLLIVHNYGLDHNRVRMELDAIADAGLSADLICLRGPGERPRETYRSTSIRRLPIRRHRGASLPVYLFEYGAFFILAALLATVLALRHRYRLVFVHSLPDALVLAAAGPKLLGARVVANLREFTPELVRTRYGVGENHWLVRLSRGIERLSCSFADRVITVHDTGRELLTSRGVPPEKLLVITNSIDLPSPAGAHARGAGPFVLLYHGTAGNEYDLETVVQALAILRERGWSASDVRLRVVGSGPAIPALREHVARQALEDRVMIEPPVPFAQVPELLATADAGVPLLRETPYAHLGIPTKLLECIGAGVPVLSAPGRAIRGYFGEEAILYVPFGDAPALAGAIAQLAGDPARRVALAQAARRALEPILPDVMRERYARLLESAVARVPSPAASVAATD